MLLMIMIDGFIDALEQTYSFLGNTGGRVATSTRGRGFASDFFKEGWAFISFLRHYDEAPTLLEPQPQIYAVDADGKQLRRHLKLNKHPSPNYWMS